MAQRLKDRLALITGASRGIGAAIAKAYAAEGAHVILVARTSGGLEEVDDEINKIGGKATLVPMDLADFDAIDDLGGQIFQRWGKLDILVGNAAMLGDLSPVSHIKPEVWQRAYDLNVTANYRLIRSMDALLRQSDAGRAIFLTSGASRSTPPYWALYASTKAALDAIAQVYAKETQKTAINVNLVNPGPTRTAMRATAFPGEDAAQLPPPSHLTETLIRLAEPDFTQTGLWVAADAETTAPGKDDAVH
ncbi:MAG: SDR family NAD(P)-dependent oxidoreductase [Rhodospirillaceae bacterium]|jgi:NAD(P)-dependent dehydrogenase (short-subunit alcohol dehydrogenase family)|nr:SDR family NAD(P)-dependent oxidoreductase [Rhodospirillaceae bacterium]MBT5080503.1 SDR family NAD(P)-dependent oxidoreductase [Rhodospirillaceae bacterium]MBT5523169.1 SDR family NAD(P)-dependent oxidoreductase [Rhodospirillaceae bacterium]MBT5879266.1 SDR family NAD(P)-dependent oxidoreductase [Rhodospirillaceae bacterium]MBT6591369.1 SDR family NAD(P)-dependent oxidoreductase [Rhodospirillaceae bacterium]